MKTLAAIAFVELGAVALFAQASDQGGARPAFEHYVTTGQLLLAALVAIAGLVAVIFGVRYRVTAEAAIALAKARGEALEDAKAREAELQSALATSKEANAQLRTSVERLEALPNLARIIDAMNENTAQQDKAAASRMKVGLSLFEQAMDRRLTQHEDQAAARHVQLLEQGEELLEALRRINRKE